MMPERRVVLEVRELRKTYRKPFTGKKVEAVRGVSFAVGEGEIFGCLGPNGAGKTTTIKMLTGLARATAGSAELFGHPVPSPRAMRHVGFLPENPYVYPYLSPREFVALCGRLSGLSGRDLAHKTEAILDRVGVLYAADREVRTLSKGMLQRVGFAAALVHEPDLLVLDEPMSGLDPVGRKEVRDLILDEKRKGRTVFFSSHILSDVEMLCDRVCILKKGEVVVSGAFHELLRTEEHRYEVTFGKVTQDFRGQLVGRGKVPVGSGDVVSVEVQGDDEMRALVSAAFDQGAALIGVMTKRQTLEDLFVEKAL